MHCEAIWLKKLVWVAVLTMSIFGNHAAQADPGSVGQAAAGCCSSRVGDVNLSGGDEPTVGDVIDLAIFFHLMDETGDPPPLPCWAEADINQSGGINPDQDDITIGDLSTLINYLFIAGPYGMSLPTCLEGGTR